jgi:para-nitrobenzyl esterase
MPLAVGAINEDCLYLNVWTPGPGGGARPVLFWIHGGAFYAGSAAEPFYHGGALAAEQDIVVVSANYRLGVLGGFVYLNELGDERLSESANVGLLDLVLALEWVRDNIEAFGGDPGCVTIAGQSAGGRAAGTLLGMPRARGLVQRAILQSPGTLSAFEPAEANALTDEFLKQLGSEDPGALVSADAAALATAVIPLVQTMTMGPYGAPLGPTLDGSVLCRQPLEEIAGGLAAGVPLLAGSTTHELELLLRGVGLDRAGDDALDQIVQLFPEELAGTGALRARLSSAYGETSLAGLDPIMPMPVVALMSDRMVRLEAIRTLEAQLAVEPHCYAYMLELPTLGDSGAPHCIDTPLLFNTLSAPDLPALLPDDEAVRRAGRALRGRWASFMRTGVPAGEDDWPPYDAADRRTAILGTSPRLVKDPWPAQRRAWEGVLAPGGPIRAGASRIGSGHES